MLRAIALSLALAVTGCADRGEAMDRGKAERLAGALISATTPEALSDAAAALRQEGDAVEIGYIAPNAVERLTPQEFDARADAMVLLVIGGHVFLWQPADKSQADWLFLE